MPSQWVFAAVVVALLVLVLVSIGAAIGRAAERRSRRGELEFDTPEARRAIAGQVSALRRCNPARGVHFHGAGDRCECGERPNYISFGCVSDRGRGVA